MELVGRKMRRRAGRTFIEEGKEDMIFVLEKEGDDLAVANPEGRIPKENENSVILCECPTR